MENTAADNEPFDGDIDQLGPDPIGEPSEVEAKVLSPEHQREVAIYFAVDARISGVYGMGWIGIQKALRVKFPDLLLDEVISIIDDAKQQMEALSDVTMSEQRALMLERLERIFTQSTSNRWKLKALDQMAQIIGLRRGDAPKVRKKKVVNINLLTLGELEQLAQLQQKLIQAEVVEEKVDESVFAPVTIDSKYSSSGGVDDEPQESEEEDHFEGEDDEDDEDDEEK